MKFDTFTERDLLESKVLKTNDREDLEKYILTNMKAIFEAYRAYNPNGTYLIMSIIGHEESEEGLYFSVRNDYTSEDKEIPLNASLTVMGVKE